MVDAVFTDYITLIMYENHAYIIDHYNPSVRITDLVSHTTYVVCVNFVHKWCEKLGQ